MVSGRSRNCTADALEGRQRRYCLGLTGGERVKVGWFAFPERSADYLALSRSHIWRKVSQTLDEGQM